MFEKTLSDLVRGLRANKANEVLVCFMLKRINRTCKLENRLKIRPKNSVVLINAHQLYGLPFNLTAALHR